MRHPSDDLVDRFQKGALSRRELIAGLMALGASASQIQRDVLTESMHLTLIGLTFGFLLSAAAGVALGNRLFGVAPTDPPTYGGVLVLLAIASLVASYVPAWRAGHVNVVEALRQE